jgi:Kef-type K+ transport system membrane component KefB
VAVPLGLGLILVIVLSFVAHQAFSWRRATGERRLRLKWLATGAAVTLVVVAASLGFSSTSVVGEILGIGLAALPVGIGVGILKYRLYEIDRIISRTLAYAIVTSLLVVGVYAGLVLLATQVLRFHSSVAVAVSTLAAAALFSPLRRRVQHAVDRRFNRARYDADQTVTAFAALLKDAVDLDSVRDDLAAVVENALEPAHVSVWIRAGER